MADGLEMDLEILLMSVSMPSLEHLARTKAAGLAQHTGEASRLPQHDPSKLLPSADPCHLSRRPRELL